MNEASVVICAYTLDRWEQLTAAVESVRAQTCPPRQIIVVIDGNEALLQRALQSFTGVTVVANEREAGLSGGRMTGAALATAPVTAFLDDEAIADRRWLEELLKGYRDPQALGACGHIEPLWSRPPPNWFPAEFNWVVGCTYAGMPVRGGRVRNMIGANMSVRAEVLRRADGFASKLGRREGVVVAGGMAESCEETEFCIRAARLHPGGFWAYRREGAGAAFGSRRTHDVALFRASLSDGRRREGGAGRPHRHARRSRFGTPLCTDSRGRGAARTFFINPRSARSCPPRGGDLYRIGHHHLGLLPNAPFRHQRKGSLTELSRHRAHIPNEAAYSMKLSRLRRPLPYAATF